MAQPVHCDIQGQEPHLADVLVSQIANGDTTAWCFTHYVDVCQAVLDTARETAAEAARTDQEAEARLEGAQPGAGEEPVHPEAGDGPAFQPSQPGPDDGPAGEAGDQPEQAGLAGPEAGSEEEPTATTTGA